MPHSAAVLGERARGAQREKAQAFTYITSRSAELPSRHKQWHSSTPADAIAVSCGAQPLAAAQERLRHGAETARSKTAKQDRSRACHTTKGPLMAVCVRARAYGHTGKHTSTVRLQVDSTPIIGFCRIQLSQQQVLLASPLVCFSILSIDVNRCRELGLGPLPARAPSESQRNPGVKSRAPQLGGPPRRRTPPVHHVLTPRAGRSAQERMPSCSAPKSRPG